MKEWVDAHDPGSAIIPFSGSLEAKLLDMNDDDRAAYLNEHQTSRSLTLVMYTAFHKITLFDFWS